MSDIDPAARARIDRWKLSLLDVSAGNRLLDAPDTRTCMRIPGVDPLRLAAVLEAGQVLAVESGQPVPVESGRLHVPLTPAEVERRLVAIRRAARANLADGGVQTLWLALAALIWLDAENVERTAPLVLVPVELERAPGGSLRLVAADRDTKINATLVEKLRRDFEVAIPDDAKLAQLIEMLDGIAVTRPGWRVERVAHLGIFSFAKLTMWHDLDAHADALMDSPVVAQLASATGEAFGNPDEVPPPITDVLAPLDADASQLAAIAAAGAGHSFVLQGPPGTGKSQTIANLIVHCVAQGKSVLFVTEKMAALEVVHQRLASVGLGELCLELHSHKSKRAEVLASLGRVLERSFRPGAVSTASDSRLVELREALDEHVRELHHHGVFGRSLHEVLGRLVELRELPTTQGVAAERDAVGLDRDTFERRKLAVEQLAAAAVPIEPIATHPWRASTLERFPLDGRDRVMRALDELGTAGDELSAAIANLQQLVPGISAKTPDQLALVGALAQLAAASPRPGAELLTQLRGPRDIDIGERVALIRAKGGGTIEVPRDPASFMLLAYRHRMLHDEVVEKLTDAVANLDASGLWAQLRKWTHRMAPLRFVALRSARNEVRAAAIPGQLETDEAMITALEAVIAERAARAALAGATEPAARWFGELGGDPLALDLAKIDAAVAWAAELRKAFDAVDVAGGEAGRQIAWRALVAQVSAGEAIDLAVFAKLSSAVTRWQPAVAALADATGIPHKELGLSGVGSVSSVPSGAVPEHVDSPNGDRTQRNAASDDYLTALGDRVELLRQAIDSLRDWVQFHGARRTALAAGVAPAVTALDRGDIGAAELATAWEHATLVAWADAELAAAPALAHFHGSAHHAQVSSFADLDRASLGLARARTVVKVAERIPRVVGLRGVGPEPGGELGTLLHELRKQRGHRPLRALFAEIPTLLPRLAPCLLMSPQSVAQYLDPSLPKFDVVVFDEASQLPTADAIGALARGRSAVIVGDSRQLPPTRFFDSQSTTATDDEPELVELESVLDDAAAARLPELHLGWHYRSKHEDLIAFANRRYYDERLEVFPTAHGGPDLGVHWRKIDGHYDRGGTRQNRLEAEAVVADVIARLRDPMQRTRSIAVVTLSRAQQDLVEDLFDAARAVDPSLDDFFEGLDADGGSTGIEPVLVKNLETIQGDERDVVLLSIGYGPDSDGKLTMNFGPLSQRGGERRLNVAITRAREQLVVFSSFSPEDITDGAPTAIRDLASLIDTARASTGPRLGADHASSPITAAIAQSLIERGWIVRHQIGAGAYKLDLAVVDPGDPDHFVLGIECDGEMYANAEAARDRDRLRAQVLGQLGWRLHRVWSLDWLADSAREIQRAHGAIVTALAAARQRRTVSGPVAAASSSRSTATTPPRSARGSGATRAPATSTGTSAPTRAARSSSGPASSAAASSLPASTTQPHIPVFADGSGPLGDLGAASAPIKLKRGNIAIGPYTAAAIPAGRRAPDDMFAPRHLAELGKVVEQVLAAEAPMHIDLLARRVGAYFGIGRVTQRVTDQVRVALAGRGKWGEESGVVWRLDQDPTGVPAVRVAGSGTEARRDIGEVPLSELAAAARLVVERAVGIGPNDLVRDTSRLLGFSRITERVTERVSLGIRLAAQREMIALADGRVTLPD